MAKFKPTNTVSQIISLLLVFGPIVLFWYVDWYLVIGYYNLVCAYESYIRYEYYDNHPNYTRKYHLIIYVGLPLIFNLIGYLISVVYGFEENKDKTIMKKSETEYYNIKNSVTGEITRVTKEEAIRLMKNNNNGVQNLMSYLEERPNFKRIYGQLVDLVNDEYSVSDYLLEADIIRRNKFNEFILSDSNIIDSFITPLNEVISFLQMDLILKQSVIEKDYNTCVKAIEVLNQAVSNSLERGESNDWTKEELAVLYAILYEIGWVDGKPINVNDISLLISQSLWVAMSINLSDKEEKQIDDATVLKMVKEIESLADELFSKNENEFNAKKIKNYLSNLEIPKKLHVKKCVTLMIELDSKINENKVVMAESLGVSPIL